MENNSNKLAVISLIINAVLIIAVIIIFVKMPSSSVTDDTTSIGSGDSAIDISKMHEKGDNAVIVYYNSDSLNTRSKFVIELQNEIMTAQTNAEKRLKAKQDELMKWDKKWKDKGMLLSSEQEQYMREGEQKQMEMMNLQQQLEQELYQTQNTLTITGITRISKYTSDLALANGYDYVFSYQLGGQIVFCNPKMDITNELIDLMNADYDASAGTPAE